MESIIRMMLPKISLFRIVAMGHDNDRIRIVIREKGTFSLEKGENVLSVLREQKLLTFSHCGGRGTCGRCVVRFISGAPLPKPGDRNRFTPERLREGYRLACLAKPEQHCEIELGFKKEETFILNESLLQREHQGNDGFALEETEDTMIITDLGTTTMVIQLMDRKSGKVIDTHCCVNPQRLYGADVVSRMQQAMNGEKEELTTLVNACIADVVSKWKSQGYSPKSVIIAGNTVMSHLYLGYDVTTLAKAPFTPVTTEAAKTMIEGIPCVVMPGISAFVGGDIVAGMLVCQREMQKEGIQYALLIDLGTNGEMALLGPDRVLCTATAAGPAFEGGADGMIRGSELIAMAAECLDKKKMDETGLLATPYFENGVTNGDLTIYQEDIRNLQMAKAAVFAGIEILLKEYGITTKEVQRVYLAGGFGYKISVEAACRIGLIPVNLKDCTVAVGNTALAGAYLYGKMLWEQKKDPAQELINKSDSINLAEKEEFHRCYVQAMELKEEKM